ncbi:tetratricopeptide repeat protein [Streptomyces sp. BK79]|uniref:tetratricopeptide repeat protein n=1 Tax=Streptomyces sp. BK79 TaxID=3350097 RepID=UPI00377040CD
MSRLTEWWARRRTARQPGLVTATSMDEVLVMSAEGGNTSAMCRLGDQLMRQGRAAEAKHWFRKAADSGSTDGMNNLGYLLVQEGQLSQAESWLAKAAERGHPEAIDNLAYVRSRRPGTS